MSVPWISRDLWLSYEDGKSFWQYSIRILMTPNFTNVGENVEKCEKLFQDLETIFSVIKYTDKTSRYTGCFHYLAKLENFVRN